MNNITSSKHSWPDYGAKIKENPTCDTVPITPNWEPLLIIGKGNIVMARILVELPLELVASPALASSASASVWKYL